jgi:hypothetical protein
MIVDVKNVKQIIIILKDNHVYNVQIIAIVVLIVDVQFVNLDIIIKVKNVHNVYKIVLNVHQNKIALNVYLVFILTNKYVNPVK